MFYIITTVKHAIWLVNSRAGSGYPARGIKMPSRDFGEILKMSLFHSDCSYFIKQLPNGFPSRIARDPCTWDVARLSESVKMHSPAARVFLRFPKVSRHPSCMDHAILHGKPFGIPLIACLPDPQWTIEFHLGSMGFFTFVWRFVKLVIKSSSSFFIRKY
jgi:hypothetical protein